MSKIFADISVSLDGYVAGPDQSIDEPLGRGGEQLHEWRVTNESWRRAHGKTGGNRTAGSEMIEEAIARAGGGIMGRKMFSGGSGPWEDDPNAAGWWGDNPPFAHEIFVLTHHERDSVAKDNGFSYNFVTGGVEAALERAQGAAGDRDVQIHGGGEAIQQFLAAGVLDELHLHVAPVLLGGGSPLFGDFRTAEDAPLKLDQVIEEDGVTHAKYMVVR